MVEIAIAAGLQILKAAPEVIDLIKTLKDNGQTEPTPQQMDEFNQARRDRGLQDIRWDSFVSSASK